VQRNLFRNQRQSQPFDVVIRQGQTVVLQAPLHSRRRALVTQAELHSDGPVQAVVVYSTIARSDAAVVDLVQKGKLVKRDEKDRGKVADGAILGQVGGVAEYSKFEGTITNGAAGSKKFYLFNIKKNQPYVPRGDDAAPLLAGKYYHAQDPSLAYGALKNHGNYGAQFVVTGNFHADTPGPCVRVEVFLDTPQEPNYPLPKLLSRSLRNTFEITRDEQKTYFYASQRGDQLNGTQSSTPIVNVIIEPGKPQTVMIRTFYAAYNTPPHTLRVETSLWDGNNRNAPGN
jgi:hypothetical protein